MRKTLTFGVFILSVAFAGTFLSLASAQEGPEAAAAVVARCGESVQLKPADLKALAEARSAA